MTIQQSAEKFINDVFVAKTSHIGSVTPITLRVVTYGAYDFATSSGVDTNSDTTRNANIREHTMREIEATSLLQAKDVRFQFTTTIVFDESAEIIWSSVAYEIINIEKFAFNLYVVSGRKQ